MELAALLLPLVVCLQLFALAVGVPNAPYLINGLLTLSFRISGDLHKFLYFTGQLFILELECVPQIFDLFLDLILYFILHPVHPRLYIATFLLQ